ncbi:Uncharacterised protein [Vibrio cholerae]|nr:Uncharacterised protein [Vibrio cholerae]
MIPACLRLSSRRKLKSGASIPTKTSGGLAVKYLTSSALTFSRRGKRPSTSTKPITANSSISNRD